MEGDLHRHGIAWQGEDWWRPRPERQGLTGTLSHAVEGRSTEQRFDHRAHEVVFALGDSPAKEDEVDIEMVAYGRGSGVLVVGQMLEVHNFRAELFQGCAKRGGIGLADLVRGRRLGGSDDLVTGGVDCDAGASENFESGGTYRGGDGRDARVDRTVDRDQQIASLEVAARRVDVFADGGILGVEGYLSFALSHNQFIGDDRIAVRWQTGPGHDFPTLPLLQRAWLGRSSGMDPGDGQDLRTLRSPLAEADPIHHDPIVRRERPVGAKLLGENATAGLLQRDLFRFEVGEVRERDGLSDGGRDQGIHGRPQANNEYANTQVFSLRLGGPALVLGRMVVDQFKRPMRDLRISITDRCNFRCRYCMPAEVFGPDYAFLPRDEILRYEEIERFVRLAVSMGVRKVRLTGGEPLLRRGVEDLVGMLAAIEGGEDLALTTNGVLLAHHAEGLRLAGLGRVTVSLDALDPEVFAQMNGVGAKVDRVLAGIESALAFGLGVKINAVVQRGVNEGEILPLVRWGRERGIPVRFIEYMDVGETNGWKMEHVVTAQEIRAEIEREFPLRELVPTNVGEVARRYGFADESGEVGIIASVTQPFCGACNRLRLSAEGKLYTCLFAGSGTDVRALLREGRDEALQELLGVLWGQRTDRYSELRGENSPHKVEMSYIGG